MSKFSRTIVNPTKNGKNVTSDETYNRELFDKLQRVLASLALRTKTSGMSLNKTSDNNVNASAQPHKIGEIDKADTFINGFAGAQTGNITFKADARISNFHFTGTVTINKDATVIFHNCRFEKLITNQDGAFSHYVGCLFKGTSAVNNLSATVTDCSIVCSSRKSGVAHTNVTVLSETQ